MAKEEQFNKSYIGLSGNGAKILNAVEGIGAFSISDVKRLTGMGRRSIINTLQLLKRRGAVMSARRDLYVVKQLLPAKTFAVANILSRPSYISFWTAFSRYGFTDQQVAAIQLVSTKQHPKMMLGKTPIETTTFPPKKFFGYTRTEDYVIAEPEKLLVDSLYMPQKAGGIGELKVCVKNSWQAIDQAKLLSYLKRFGVKALNARLGYLLDGIKAESKISNELLRNLPRGFVKLNPSNPKSSEYDRKWGVIVNDY